MSKKKLSALATDLQKVKYAVENPKYLMQVAQFVAGTARMNAPAHSGALRSSINVSLVKSPTELVAHIGTNLEYALYVELGTGPKGASNHTGISPDVTPTYSTSPWWIHESQIDAMTASQYGWYCLTTEAGKFYQVTGQPAQPYLYPALKDNEQEIAKILAGAWEKAIK